jgi:hypothetical protein
MGFVGKIIMRNMFILRAMKEVKMFKDKDCTKCPAYNFNRDYWGEVSENCLIRDYKHFSCGCKLPMILRRLLYLKYKIREAIACIRMDRDYKRELKKWENEEQ